MKRDTNLLKEILLEIEGGKKQYDTMWDDMANALSVEPTGLSREYAETLNYHLEMLDKDGFVEFSGNKKIMWRVSRITTAGHNLLDTLR